MLINLISKIFFKFNLTKKKKKKKKLIINLEGRAHAMHAMTELEGVGWPGPWPHSSTPLTKELLKIEFLVSSLAWICLDLQLGEN
jgi:hypothetical protein